jgi:16S rRNA processing protein RimM
MADNTGILVGVIQGAFGVRGELRVKSFTADPAALFKYSPFLNEKGDILFEVKSWRAIKDGFSFYPKKAITREDAMALRNVKLFVPREKFSAPEEDEYYQVDLIGLRVEDLLGNYLGKVKAIITTNEDLLEIEDTPNVKKSWFVPFTRENVPIVDIKNQKLICDLPEGFLELEEA